MNLQPLLAAIPQTGENTDYMWWAPLLLLVGIALLAAFVFLGKKK